MSFLRSPIKAGPVRPSVMTGIFSYQSHCLCLCFCFYFLFLSLVTTVLPCPGADWWIIDKPPVF